MKEKNYKPSSKIKKKISKKKNIVLKITEY